MSGGGRGRRGVPDWVVGLGFVSPWIVGFVLFLAVPIGLSLFYSMSDYSMLEPPLWIGTGNYERLARDGVFWKAIINTLVYAGVSIPVGTGLALVIAWLLNNEVRGISLFRAAVFLPTLVPIVASAMIWMWLFNGELGLINTMLGWVGVRGPNWLGSASWAMPALVMMSLWSIGNAVVIYLAALKDVPRALYEAAQLDGVGPAGRFWHVTMPMISPVILFNVIMAIIGAWQVFAVPYIMTNGGPDRATYFYTMYLYDEAFSFLEMGYASAMAWVQLLIILALTGATFVVSRGRVHYRAG